MTEYCKRGHERTPENTRKDGRCRPCRIADGQRYQERHGLTPAHPYSGPTCSNGHLRAVWGTHAGYRRCRKCALAAGARWTKTEAGRASVQRSQDRYRGSSKRFVAEWRAELRAAERRAS